MLENEDIQHILLTRTPALTGRYEFLSFRNGAGGRAWLSAIHEKAQSAAEVTTSVDKDKRWVTLAFTWNGLRALGVDEGSLATFPEEFKQGMVARAEMLGDTGENHPDNWVGGLASPDLHAIAILFARDAAERGRCQTEHDKLVAQCQGVEVLSDAGPGGDAAVRLRTRPLRLPRPALAAGHRGHWRSADARHRHAAQAGRIHPRVPGRKRTARQSAATRNSFPQRQLSWPIADCRSMWSGFAISCASTARRPKNRN